MKLQTEPLSMTIYGKRALLFLQTKKITKTSLISMFLRITLIGNYATPKNGNPPQEQSNFNQF